MSDAKWWVTLYDPEGEIVAVYQIGESLAIDRYILSLAIQHPNIEYLKLTTNPPDRLKSAETSRS